MINKSLALLLALLISVISSCSFLSQKVESLVEISENKTSEPVKQNKKNLYCVDNNKVQLLLEDESTLKYYSPFIGQLFETKNYSFIQKSIMLSLIEMSRRPDEASPSARLQYFLHLKGKSYYFDFSSLKQDESFRMPFIKGLEYLVKNFDNSKSLNSLAESLDQIVPQAINVSPEFESFLLQNKNELQKKDSFSQVFFKGDEVLTKHESFKRISYKKVISLFNNDKSNQDANFNISKNSLTDIDVGQNNLTVKCNTDINKENSLREELLNSSLKKSHYFAIKDGENFFIALSSELLDKSLRNIKDTYLISSKGPIDPLPICQFFNNDEDIVLFSTSGRNPVQHLKHLVTYDIALVSSYQSLKEILNFSRHLFLSSPDRILYESKRGRKSQLDFFLSMNFPIYHVDALGDIVGSATFNNQGRADRSLIIDDRSTAKLWCSP